MAAPEANKDRSAYWQANLKLVGGLMLVWFMASFGAGILFVDQLNTIRKQEQLDNKPFDVWSGIQNPGPETHQRLEAAGVTMTNGTNFLDHTGKAAPSTIDDKKRKMETFAESFLVEYAGINIQLLRK